MIDDRERCGNDGRRSDRGKLSSRVTGSPSSTSSFPRPPLLPWKSQTARFPHSHSTATAAFPLFKSKIPRALRARTKPTKGAFPAARRCRFSGSSRFGMKLEVQAHLVLESKADFRLTSGLENAPSRANNVERGQTFRMDRIILNQGTSCQLRHAECCESASISIGSDQCSATAGSKPDVVQSPGRRMPP